MSASFSHVITDLCGFAVFMKAWAAASRNEPMIRNKQMPFPVPIGTDVLADTQYVRPPGWYAPYEDIPIMESPPLPYTTIIIQMSDQDLANAKTKATTDIAHHNGKWISTHDAFVALVWRALAKAVKSLGIPTSMVNCAIDLRTRLNLPRDNFGNFFTFVFYLNLSLPTTKLLAVFLCPYMII